VIRRIFNEMLGATLFDLKWSVITLFISVVALAVCMVALDRYLAAIL